MRILRQGNFRTFNANDKKAVVKPSEGHRKFARPFRRCVCLDAFVSDETQLRLLFANLNHPRFTLILQ